MNEEINQLREASRKHAIMEFMLVCPVEDEHEAEFFLGQHNFEVEAAIQDYLDNPNKAIQQMRKNEQDHRIRELLRKQKLKGKHDGNSLWRQDPTGETVKFSLVPPNGQRPGAIDFNESLSEYLPLVRWQKGFIQDSIRKSLQTSKPILVFCYSHDLIGKIGAFFSKENIEIMNQGFIVTGLFKHSEDVKRILTHYFREHTGSSFMIFRVNVFDQLVLHNHYLLSDKSSTPDSLQGTLKYALKSIAEDKKEEMDIVEKHKHMFVQHDEEDVNEMHIEDETDYAQLEEERMIRQAQEESHRELEAEHTRKMSEQRLREEEERKEEEKLNELMEERKIRKMSLPDEPLVGQGVISIAFRVPGGGKVVRNFNKSQKLDFVYNFVELDDEIKFQNELHRKFDIKTIAPPASLSDRKEETLEQVFENSDQETLLIVQL